MLENQMISAPFANVAKSRASSITYESDAVP